MSRIILALLVAALSAGALSACGKKGDPHAPNPIEREYPKPEQKTP